MLLKVINLRARLRASILLILRYLHNMMETQRKKQGFSWKRQNHQSWALRPILQPFEILRRYTIYIFGVRKA